MHTIHRRASIRVVAEPAAVFPTIRVEDPKHADDKDQVVAAIEQGLADGKAGRAVDDRELDDQLADRLGELTG